MNNSFAVQSRSDAKQRLIKAGLEIFGTFNLEGATTRQLAERAGVNQAAIPYLLYERWIRPVHETLAALLAVILQKSPTDPNVILRTHMLVGQIQKAVFDQLDLFLQPLIRPVPLILEDVANQRADLANIGVVDAN